MVKEIKIEDFSYELPDSQIARHPLAARDECKLLLRTHDGRLYHRVFKELPDLLPPGTMMVCNDTKVINARILFHKETGAAIEIFLLEPVWPSDYAMNFQSTGRCSWKCLVGNLKKWKDGLISARVAGGEEFITLSARRIKDYPEGGCEIEFSWDSPISFGTLLEKAGKIPIPPYLNRDSEESDLTDYQTVFAEVSGSVAAPTAGLHFTPRVFEGLAAHAIPVEKLTLHVGAGTFRPVKSETIGDHDMHSEPFTVTKTLVGKLIEWKKDHKPVLATGTTTVRTLESLPYIGKAIEDHLADPFHLDQWRAYSQDDFDTVSALQILYDFISQHDMESVTASTAIMIAPGFRWRITDIMVTNFHQPQSTLLLLVSSFLGEDKRDEWRKIYKEALEKGYRFLSYGDACLFFH